MTVDAVKAAAEEQINFIQNQAEAERRANLQDAEQELVDLGRAAASREAKHAEMAQNTQELEEAIQQLEVELKVERETEALQEQADAVAASQVGSRSAGRTIRSNEDIMELIAEAERLAAES